MSDDLQRLLDSLTEEERRALLQRARDECWRSGDLTYKLHSDQLKVYRAIQERDASREVLEIARRWGKTYLLTVIAAETCLQTPNCRVVYGAPTLKHLEEFIIPTLEAVAEDAPEDCRPKYHASEGHWRFPNGSYVHLFGADDKTKADRGRGPEAKKAIFDEAGFCKILKYVLRSIFRPQLLHSRGRTLLGSTPAEEPDHDFTLVAETAEANGTYERRTIYDNPRLTPERIEEFIAEDAKDEGMTVEEYIKTDTFRREYLAERVTNKTLMVMGDDWERAAPTAVSECVRPQFFDAYAVLDMGGVDPRACLWGYWDFSAATLVVEDELNLRNNENTLQLADGIKHKESALYGTKAWDGTLRAIRAEKMDERMLAFLPEKDRQRVWAAENAPLQPFLRVCDHDIQTAIDLSVLHGLTFLPAEKTTLVMVVNDARVALRMGRIRIHPRCRDLIRQLRTSLWNNEKALDFQRRNGEHADLLWCLIYMWRNIRKSRNPVPENWGLDPENQYLRPKTQTSGLAAIVGGRRR